MTRGTQEFRTRSGGTLVAETLVGEGNEVEISVTLNGARPCLLHWAVSPAEGSAWRMPPRSAWPEGSQPFGDSAVQTPFVGMNGKVGLQLRLDMEEVKYPTLAFVLFYPEENRWDNNHGRNYYLRLPQQGVRPQADVDLLATCPAEGDVRHEKVYELEGEGRLAVRVSEGNGETEVVWVTDVPGPVRLHWGTNRRRGGGWLLPPEVIRPSQTTLFRDNAAQTPFVAFSSGAQGVRMRMADDDAPVAISFVLLKGEDPGRWLKNRGGDFFVPVSSPRGAAEQSLGADLDDVASDIIAAETGKNSWTLMHRFNLCWELLDRVAGSRDGLALLFVWLRFSAIRQLDWQRNYNTKPRELSHAMERLTNKLADLYFSGAGDALILRLLFATLGRGGEGQRIRDEILEIMHRHHIKEVTGAFMEEWHQKMHNNTTPDDIVICEAYLEFLRSNGNLDVFYSTLREGGVSRERLQSYERPLRTDPDFPSHLKDALIHDFMHFHETLTAVHAGVDLDASIKAAGGAVDDDLRSLLHFVRDHRNDDQRPVAERAEKITEARRRLNEVMRGGHRARDLLFLDLSLEVTLRAVVEGNIHAELTENDLNTLISLVLENTLLSSESQEELRQILRHWDAVRGEKRVDRSQALELAAVLERLEHAVGASGDDLAHLLQPKAVHLGEAFQAEPWTIRIFSEEVVRGTLASVLSMLARKAGVALRKSASLGMWRVISAGRASGTLRFATELVEVQRSVPSGSTVVLAERVTGDEEIPRSITAVLAAQGVDVLSHLAIRSRNTRVPFASCYDPDEFGRLRGLEGRLVGVDVHPSGRVSIEEGTPERGTAPREVRPTFRAGFTQPHGAYAIPAEEFAEGLVGEKALNTLRLRGKLPDWIHQPGSAAVPFGAFEKVLEDPRNEKTAKRYAELVTRVDDQPAERLAAVRDAVSRLEPPQRLLESLQRVLAEAGLPVPGDVQKVWSCIKHVWASKWTERAYLSRKANGIPHDEMFMSVLVQQVVEAEYAFVVHTANPLSGNRDEVYAEVVPGLGETITGGYAGAALGFTSSKKRPEPRLLCCPSKSVALYGSGLIFRSDSNAEDLAGYAGAGLYESIMLDPPRSVILDYLTLPLLRDRGFRRAFLSAVVHLGVLVEEIMGAPQDIEGGFSGGLYYVVQTRPQVGVADDR